MGLGELSVGYHAPIGRWVMSYQAASVVVRTSRSPIGPWSEEVVVFDGNLAYAAADNLAPGHEFVGLPHDEHEGPTGSYAPYLVPSWTRFDRSTRILTLYYTLSTEHPPYNVQLMRSRLFCH
jgi:hypothetical protein